MKAPPLIRGITLISLLISITLSLLLLGASFYIWQVAIQQWHLHNTLDKMRRQANITFQLITTSLQNHNFAEILTQLSPHPIQKEPFSKLLLPPHFHRAGCCQKNSDSIAFAIKTSASMDHLCQPADFPTNSAIGFWLFIEDHSLKCKPYQPTTNTLLNKNAIPLVFGIYQMTVKYGLVNDEEQIEFHQTETVKNSSIWENNNVAAISINLTLESDRPFPWLKELANSSIQLTNESSILQSFNHWIAVKPTIHPNQIPRHEK